MVRLINFCIHLSIFFLKKPLISVLFEYLLAHYCGTLIPSEHDPSRPVFNHMGNTTVSHAFFLFFHGLQSGLISWFKMIRFLNNVYVRVEKRETAKEIGRETV